MPGELAGGRVVDRALAAGRARRRLRPPIQWLTRPGAGTSARAAPGSATCVMEDLSCGSPRCGEPMGSDVTILRRRGRPVASHAQTAGAPPGRATGARWRPARRRPVVGHRWSRRVRRRIVMSHRRRPRQPTATPSAMTEPMSSGPTTAGSRQVSAIDRPRDGPQRDADQEQARPSRDPEGPEATRTSPSERRATTSVTTPSRTCDGMRRERRRERAPRPGPEVGGRPGRARWAAPGRRRRGPS